MFVKWDVTGKCNLACLHCSVGKVYQMGNSKYNDLNNDEILNICDKLIDAGVSDVQILGGEPFARTDILQIIKKLSDAQIRISINTNAQLLSEELISELAKYKVYMINISFDGVDEATNDFVRGKGSFRKTLNKLHMLMEHEDLTENTRIGINFVLMKHTLNYAKQLIDLCLDQHVKYLSVNDLWITQNALENESDIYFDSIGDKLKFVDELCRYNDSRIDLKIESMPLLAGVLNLKHNMHLFTSRGCGAGDEIIYIQANGDVFPCIKCRGEHSLFQNKEMEHLNILKCSLEEIINSQYFKNFCEYKMNIKNNDEICNQCLYQSLCNPCPFDIYNDCYTRECKAVEEMMLLKEG